MRSHELDLSRYDSDKVISGYLHVYDQLFQSMVHQPIKLLEVGVYRGGSLRLWRDYFPNGQITGVDLKLPDNLQDEERISVFQGSQDDGPFLHQVASKVAPDGFDIIIDDASHLGDLTRKTFWHLFEQHLKPGGFYIIEDWGTGYWSDWPDGQSEQPASLWSRFIKYWNKDSLKQPWPTHSFGMVGFVKQLVDEMGASERLKTRREGAFVRDSFFERIQLTSGLVIITKKRSVPTS